MRPSELTNALDSIGHYRHHLAARLLDAHSINRTYRDGHYLGSTPTDTIIATGGLPGRPVEQRVVTTEQTGPDGDHTGWRTDPAVADYTEVKRRLERILADLDWLDRYCGRYTPPATARTLPDDGCASCARLRTSDGQPRWSPAHATPASIDGVPNRPLCRWCYDVALLYAAWPPLTALTLHAAGQRVPRKLLDPPTAGATA